MVIRICYSSLDSDGYTSWRRRLFKQFILVIGVWLNWKGRGKKILYSAELIIRWYLATISSPMRSERSWHKIQIYLGILLFLLVILISINWYFSTRVTLIVLSIFLAGSTVWVTWVSYCFYLDRYLKCYQFHDDRWPKRNRDWIWDHVIVIRFYYTLITFTI